MWEIAKINYSEFLSLFKFIHVYMHKSQCVHEEVRGELVGIGSLLPQGVFQGLDSGCRAWKQMPLQMLLWHFPDPEFL